MLRHQLEDVRGSTIDENGSLDLLCGTAAVARVEKRVPTEGEATDVDGTTIHYLLHVVGGKLKELEVYKDDSSRVLQHPDPDEVRVVVLG
jgi:hypothetical protein